MYLNDVATIPANLAGTPGLSLPVGLAPEDGLPGGAPGDGARPCRLTRGSTVSVPPCEAALAGRAGAF